MHRMKEVILKILAQESQDLELRLKRYGILMFRAIFVDFSEAKDLSGIIFQILGANYEIRYCGLIFENPRGFFAKLSGIIYFGIIFPKKTRGSSPQVHGPPWLGPPWTGGPSSPELSLWPLRCSWALAKGRRMGETGSGNPLRASTEDGRWRGGRAMEGNGRRQSVCQ
jgi:hypothetical protein